MTKATSLTQAKQDLLSKNIPLIEIDEFGYVALIGYYGSDDHICEVARLTSGSSSKDNESLIRYLLRKRHSSPFEFCLIELEVALPIFVERQWVRHRMSGTNEVSARYSELPGEVWQIPNDRIAHSPQASVNRQGSGSLFEESQHDFFKERYAFSTESAVNTYQEFISKDMAPEIARTCLPLSTYTRKRWKCDLHNLLHFLGLRIDVHAQKEIRDYANAVAKFTKDLFPITYKAFEDYRINTVSFSKIEIKILESYLANEIEFNMIPNLDNDSDKLGKTEMTEFKAKLRKIIGE